MSEMGMFNHVPKSGEVAAKAFSMSRDEQEQWSWPSYCCGLSDGGVCDARVTEIMFAAMNGEFSHNTEQAFSGEPSPMHDHIEQLEVENAKLRELAVGMYGILVTFDVILGNHDVCETPRPLIFGEDKSFKDVMRELGVEAD